MKIDVVEGRGFSIEFPGDVNTAYVLNEEALRQSRIKDPIGKVFGLYGSRGKIVGVVKDTRFRNFRRKFHPEIYYLFRNLPEESFGGVVLIRVEGVDNARDLSEVISHVEKVWMGVNSFAPFEYHFLDETIEAQYRNEQRLGRLFGTFSFLAVFISCLGLFGLASFVAEQRTKEIGIRKTLGAGVRDIFVMLSKDFTKWVLVANILAWPVAHIFMNSWLRNFTYRMTISVWDFVLAGLMTLLIALLTVSYQTLKAALANPVDSLRYE
jgi:putative ABC transport system permease protein